MKALTESIDERIEDSLTLGGDAILTSAPRLTPAWERSAYALI
jgi:hypothetical protein